MPAPAIIAAAGSFGASMAFRVAASPAGVQAIRFAQGAAASVGTGLSYGFNHAHNAAAGAWQWLTGEADPPPEVQTVQERIHAEVEESLRTCPAYPPLFSPSGQGW